MTSPPMARWNVMCPWAVCFAAYTFLHWTYPRDRDAAAAAAALRKAPRRPREGAAKIMG